MKEDKLDVEILSDEMRDGMTAKLDEPFRVKVKGKEITVPKGFVTDFASVPRLFWRIVPPCGLHSKAAVVHDWLYQSGIFDKETADLIFQALMIRYGVSPAKAKLMYWAVKMFGGAAWKACRKRQETLPVNIGGPGMESLQ